MEMPYRKEEKEAKDWKDWETVQIVYKTTKSKRATAMILATSRKKSVCFSYKSDADAIYEETYHVFPV